MLLAAGLGERMRPLTRSTPKPLLEVGGRALIDWHLHALAAAGVRDVVINVSWLADKITAHCGDGSAYGLVIAYSREEAPLETAGGIIGALPQLGERPFLVLNSDIWTDYPLATLVGRELPEAGAHLVLVDNPPHHPGGDFSLLEEHVVEAHDATFTFAGLGLYHPRFFEGYARGKRPLLPLLERAIAEGRLRGEHYAGRWTDVGTPERLAQLDEALKRGR
jgi:MurNAc alpha-1-phosphate uridylyltransferase